MDVFYSLIQQFHKKKKFVANECTYQSPRFSVYLCLKRRGCKAFVLLGPVQMNPGQWTTPGNDCPGASFTSHSHDDLLLPWGQFIVIWSLRIYLSSFSFCTDCYREWILNTFTYFWCFLELFTGKFIANIDNKNAQDYSCPRATFAFCSHGEKLPWQGGLPGVVQRVTRLSKLPRGNEKLMWTVTGVRPCTEAKLTPGSVSCPGAMSCPGIMWTGPKSQK